MTKTFSIERTYDASLEDVWALWTTADGIESWWGPEGFTVKVIELELRPQGTLIYVQTATGPEQIEFMKRAGMPRSTTCRINYVEVIACTRLHYTQLADFIPGVTPYDLTAVVELSQQAGRVKMVMTHDVMHDDVWTQRAKMGWEGELGKLERLLAAKK